MVELNEAGHNAVTKIMTSQGPYGTGVTPNPYAAQVKEIHRRHQTAARRQKLTDKILSLIEPRFVTGIETSEVIEALIAMTDSRRILEIGMCTGFTTLHMLRAVIGKPGGSVVSVDSRPAHDRQFFAHFPEFTFLEGWTPQVLATLAGPFHLVFVDSDHTIEHTDKELKALWPLTTNRTVICFHDVPQWQTPDNHTPPPVREWLLRHPDLEGLCLPSCEQLDCLNEWGAGYPQECNPGLGIFVRK